MGVAAVVRSLVVAFATSLLLTPLAIRWLIARGNYDVPNARSSHTSAVPRGAGMAVATAALAGAASVATSSQLFIVPLVAGALFGVIGTFEDLIGMSAGRRLAAQSAVALVAAVALEQAPHSTLRNVAQVLVVAGFVTAVCNVFNFMDGINGISSAQALASGLLYIAYGRSSGFVPLQVGGLAVVAATLGFIGFNFPRARVFLGDSGSYFLGGWLALFASAAFVQGLNPLVLAAPLSLYLADTSVTIVGRLVRREPIMEPHRDHAYQRLVQAGWSHTRTTVLVFTLSCTHGGIAFGLRSTAGGWQVAGVIAIAATTAGFLLLPHRSVPPRSVRLPLRADR